MPMTPETIKALNYIIDAHTDGSSDQIRADKYKCHLAQIRSVLALVKKLGTTVKHQAHGHKYTGALAGTLGAGSWLMIEQGRGSK